MRNKLRAYFQGQVREVEQDRALSLYGVALSLLLPLAYLFWRESFNYFRSDPVPYCWPGVDCFYHPLRALGPDGWFWYMLAGNAVSFFAAFSFWRNRIGAALIALGLATLLKIIQQATSYTLMGNYHYMPYIITLGFLFIPGRRAYLPIQLVLFYVAAGFLKINPEWLSGYALPGRIPYLAERWFRFLLGYVIILEILFVWGLLSSEKKWRALAFLQIAAFTAVSWYFVGSFYPITMSLLLSLFPLSWVITAPARSKLNLAAICALGIFVGAQAFPKAWGPDPALHTYRRLISLNMFDANPICDSAIYLRKKGEILELDGANGMALRLQCDPILLVAKARALCRELKSDPTFINLDVHMEARRMSGHQFETVLREENFCGN
ncbi:MAG: hypothetical protein EOP11_08500 [Proteobacteria bacterium]|nr:MAG: hypothetical protein EOP11_08500 [Pseudomonadota bacterium]